MLYFTASYFVRFVSGTIISLFILISMKVIVLCLAVLEYKQIYYFPFKIQTKLDNSLIINFSFISLYQDVKRKQALLRNNLPAISILTVRSNATWGGGHPPLFLYY